MCGIWNGFRSTLLKPVRTAQQKAFTSSWMIINSKGCGISRTSTFRCCANLALCAPDFSMYTDMPLAMQIYNHYRKHWLAAYWQQCGIHVVPTLCWSNEQSYEWCFDGEPQHSIVAISSVGTQKGEQNQVLFEKGVRAALAKLEPSEILWYGKCPEEFDWNVTRIQPYYKQVKRRCENGR
nr:MAG TPA: protein of unknown function (DUF4417) [Caudoviricetes sp.]